jgi:hypothetical protein
MDKRMFAIGMVFLTVVLMAASSGTGQTEKPKIAPICKQCHAPDGKVLRGVLGGISGKAKTIQVNIGAASWLAKWDEDTALVGAESFGKIPKEKEIAAYITEKDGGLYVTKVSVKQPAKVPAEKLIKVEEVARLIETGAEKGRFLIVDSRPAPRYHEGHIPGAVSIYDAEFDKNAGKLPGEKDILLIFYCGGPT